MRIPTQINLNIIIKFQFLKQKMFYYKLNLIQPNFTWYGSKICKKIFKKPPMVKKYKVKKISFMESRTLFFSHKNIIILI